MALTTYAELKAAVASYLHRDDLAAQIGDFVALAEERISRDLADVAAMWTNTAALTIGTGTSTFALPADALGLHRARITTGTASALDQRSVHELLGLDPASTGRPRWCALAGNGGAGGTLTVMVWPKADADYAVEAVYQAALAPLSDINTTGWLLTRAPSLYLFGALAEAEPFLINDERIMVWEGKYQRAIESVRGQAWDGTQNLLRTDLPRTGAGAWDINNG